MTRPYRLLSSVTVAEPPSTITVESDFVVILAGLLCAMICVVGLIIVARCAWFRRRSVAIEGRAPDPLPANKGIKKKVIEAIPKFTYDSNVKDIKLCSSDCVICLAEYADGDEIRVLPECGHGFHVGCIDTWLSSHSSCPSCRMVLVSIRCKKCGELPTETVGDEQLEGENKCRQHSSSSSSSDYSPC